MPKMWSEIPNYLLLFSSYNFLLTLGSSDGTALMNQTGSSVESCKWGIQTHSFGVKDAATSCKIQQIISEGIIFSIFRGVAICYCYTGLNDYTRWKWNQEAKQVTIVMPVEDEDRWTCYWADGSGVEPNPQWFARNGEYLQRMGPSKKNQHSLGCSNHSVDISIGFSTWKVHMFRQFYNKLQSLLAQVEVKLKPLDNIKEKTHDLVNYYRPLVFSKMNYNFPSDKWDDGPNWVMVLDRLKIVQT